MEPDLVKLSVHVQPGAKRCEIVSVLPDQTIKIKISAPPVDGKANELLLDFLREVLGLKKSQVILLRGDKSRTKIVGIQGKAIDQVLETLQRKVG